MSRFAHAINQVAHFISQRYDNTLFRRFSRNMSRYLISFQCSWRSACRYSSEAFAAEGVLIVDLVLILVKDAGKIYRASNRNCGIYKCKML
jgi:hypothetical protein